MLDELLAERHTWWRIADAGWQNPLDPDYAKLHGGRWNAPGSFATLYLNEDIDTARLNLRSFIALWPYEPEDLRGDTGPVLVAATLPRQQRVCTAHTDEGLRAVGLPASYPLDSKGNVIPRVRCQRIGAEIRLQGLRGVRCRSAQGQHGDGRELAWYPATSRSTATLVRNVAFDDWYWR